MSKRVKVKVQPGQTVRFPGLCVYTLEPATGAMPVHHQDGRVTRVIDVPISAKAQELLQSESAGEQRARTTGRIGAAAVTGASILLALLLLPEGLPWLARLAGGAAVGAVLAFALLRVADRESRRRALPEKKALLDAVQIEHFSWRATTFLFANETYADHFATLNEPYLMEVDPLP